ncbi:uncharacterized protein CBL_11671 [Carabus blaptoides fortunei]
MNESAMMLLLILIMVCLGAEQLNVSNRCRCMEYWQCFRSGGNFSSYCGLDESEVCCRAPRADVDSTRSLQTNCGKKGKDSGKIGTAEPTEWPWHTAILEKANHIYICGASLIDEHWILTAAHCVDNYVSHNGVRSITARLGEFDVRNNAEFHRHEEYDFAYIILHPEFSNRTLQNDIALLRLRFPVQRRPNIDFVCIPKIGMDFDSKQNCFVTGWGRRSQSAKHSEILKEVEVPLWPKIRCDYALKSHFGTNYSLPDTVLCAGAEGNDACDGDGGGPLVCEDTGQWYQVGVVSFGLGCGEKDTPGIYTKLNVLEPWIRNIIQSET